MMKSEDFPSPDIVINRLQDYVKHFKEMIAKETDEEEIEFLNEEIERVRKFSSDIGEYVNSVVGFVSRNDSIRLEYEGEIANEMLMENDRNRSRVHTRIVKNVVFMDRIAQRNGLKQPFENIAEEFMSDYSPLLPTTPEEKAKMTSRAKEKRRDIGNFALYFGISCAALELSSKEISAYVDGKQGECYEGEKNYDATKVEDAIKRRATKNINDMIDMG